MASYVHVKKVSSQQIPQTFRLYCTNPCAIELSYSLYSSYDIPINFSALLVDAFGCNSILLALIDGRWIYSVCILEYIAELV